MPKISAQKDGKVLDQAGPICPSMDDLGSALDVSSRTKIPQYWLTVHVEHFALQEVHYFVARFVQTFVSMKSHDDRPWLELYALAMTCKNGVQCSLERA
jgi:hypothetical protein